MPLLWAPRDYRLSDPTLILVGAEYHLFYESVPLADQARLPPNLVCHAVSKNMIDWEELPVALELGPQGAFDGYSIYHLDVRVHQGVWYMFYTGLDKPRQGQQQAIGLATSRDGIRFTRHSGNPILCADPRWYEPFIPPEATYQAKDGGRLWFRDPMVIEDPAGGFGMIVQARDLAKHPDTRGCISWATSKDLIHWESHPPIFSPDRFHTLETPSLFAHGGRHYLIYLTHHHWGTPYLTTDPYQNAGNFYAISDNGPAGPYRQPADEIVIAAADNIRMFSERSILGHDGQRYLYGILNLRPLGETEGNLDLRPDQPGRVLPPPKPLRFLPDGQMQVVYPRYVEERYSVPEPLLDLPREEKPHWRLSAPPGVTGPDAGVVGKDYLGRNLLLSAQSFENVIFWATIEFHHGLRAGLVLRSSPDGAAGWQVVADRQHQRIEFSLLDGGGTFIDARAWPRSDRLELKVIADLMSVEIYLDDRLMIHQVRYGEKAGSVGLLVDRAEAGFHNVHLRRLTR